MFRDLPLTPLQADQLARHYQLLCKWNKILNLTRIEDVDEVVERHYRESILLAAQIPDSPGLRIADIGSGAGFPGFPIAVFRPQWSVTLIESHQRKAVFLREAARIVSNVRVLSQRAETVPDPFDWVVSRAVSYSDLWSIGFLRSANLALLTGEEEPPSSWNREWQSVPVPGGKRRFFRVSRETKKIVSRETGKIVSRETDESAC